MSAPLVPSHDHDVHLVLCGFGEHGTAYVETDPTNADRNAVIRTLLAGEYDRPISVIAFNRSRNGNYTNGEWTAEAIEEWRWLPVARPRLCENGRWPMSKRLRVMSPPPAILLVPLVGAAGGGQFDTNIAASPAAASA